MSTVIKLAVIVAASPNAPLMTVVSIIIRGTVREASLTYTMISEE
jgi:hypothetical protein